MSSYRYHCRGCDEPRLFVKEPVNHPLHLALSVITLGLWAVSWLSLCIGRRFQPWRCCECGDAQTFRKAARSQKKKKTETQRVGLAARATFPRV